MLSWEWISTLFLYLLDGLLCSRHQLPGVDHYLSILVPGICLRRMCVIDRGWFPELTSFFSFRCSGLLIITFVFTWNKAVKTSFLSITPSFFVWFKCFLSNNLLAHFFSTLIILCQCLKKKGHLNIPVCRARMLVCQSQFKFLYHLTGWINGMVNHLIIIIFHTTTYFFVHGPNSYLDHGFLEIFQF